MVRFDGQSHRLRSSDLLAPTQLSARGAGEGHPIVDDRFFEGSPYLQIYDGRFQNESGETDGVSVGDWGHGRSRQGEVWDGGTVVDVMGSHWSSIRVAPPSGKPT